MMEDDIKVGFWVVRLWDKSITVVEIIGISRYGKEIQQIGSDVSITIQEAIDDDVEFLKWFDPKELL